MTIRLDDRLERLLQAEASRQHMSPDELAARLLRRALALEQPNARDLSGLAGGWSAAETEQFLHEIAAMDEADLERLER